MSKMQKTKIKASAVNNLTDARYFAAREVEWLGFRLSGDPETVISRLATKAIMEWVDGVKIVGEFDFTTASEIEETNNLLHLDAVQVGMFTPIEELEGLQNLTVIKEVVVELATTEAELLAHFQQYAHCCTYFLLDFTKAGINWSRLQAGIPVSIDFLRHLFSEHKTILSLDFPTDEVRTVLEILQPEGLNLTGGVEEKVGFKSFDELDEILDNLEMVG
jgi:phosphoribosylanthranilate isomerase